MTEITEEFIASLIGLPYKSKICVTCKQCKKEIYRTKHAILRRYWAKAKLIFCGATCYGLFNDKRIVRTCVNCQNKTFTRFCSQSCSAIYNNMHKKTGHRRAKLEIAIEKKLLEAGVTFVCNDRKTVGYELDFFFPTLRKAIEINGIYHYKPVHSEAKFKRIQEIDNEKIQRCEKANIQLLVKPNLYIRFTPEIIEKTWTEIKEFLDR